MHKSLLAIIAAALVASLSVQAQNTGNTRYKWHDGQGLMHFSDSLTAEAMKYGYELVNDRGMGVRRVPRQRNAEARARANKDRKTDGEGKEGRVRLDTGGRPTTKKKT